MGRDDGRILLTFNAGSSTVRLGLFALGPQGLRRIGKGGSSRQARQDAQPVEKHSRGGLRRRMVIAARAGQTLALAGNRREPPCPATSPHRPV